MAFRPRPKHIPLPQSEPTAERPWVIEAPSPSINENIFEHHGDDRMIEEISATIGQLRKGCESARNGAIAHLNDERWPIGQRHLHASDFAHRCISPAIQMVDRVEKKLNEEIAALQKKTSAPGPIRDLIAGEIRARLSTMPAGERMELVAGTIREGSDDLASAILSAPAFLSGLSEVQRSHVRETWRRARMPDDCARIELLQKRQADLARAADLSLAFAMKCSNEHLVQRTKESAKRAANALAAASAALH